jgi:hypothetical protein
MASQRNEIIQLSDDEDGDSQPRRATAPSLPSSTPNAERTSTTSLPKFGSIQLNRRRMEEERIARLGRKRKVDEDGGSLPLSQKPKLSRQPSLPPSPSTYSLPFARGAVKRTWASGYERRGDDIKIEEVLQKDQLELAVLASFQWDDEWLMRKIDLRQTKVMFVAYAQNEEHQDQNRANAPSQNVDFCFPPMDGGGHLHTKLQLLKFSNYLRIVVSSANLTAYDWGETGVLENVSGLASYWADDTTVTTKSQGAVR